MHRRPSSVRFNWLFNTLSPKCTFFWLCLVSCALLIATNPSIPGLAWTRTCRVPWISGSWKQIAGCNHQCLGTRQTVSSRIIPTEMCIWIVTKDLKMVEKYLSRKPQRPILHWSHIVVEWRWETGSTGKALDLILA